ALRARHGARGLGRADEGRAREGDGRTRPREGGARRDLPEGGRLMAGRCEMCGNEDDKAFQVMMSGASHTFDSFECAIEKLGPRAAPTAAAASSATGSRRAVACSAA